MQKEVFSYFYEPEELDQPPDVFELFQFYNQFFFHSQLSTCIIKWSKRMTLCAGTCAYNMIGGCTITLSESLLQYRSNNEIKVF